MITSTFAPTLSTFVFLLLKSALNFPTRYRIKTEMRHVSSTLHLTICFHLHLGRTLALAHMYAKSRPRVSVLFTQNMQAAKAKNPIMATIKGLLAQVFKIEVRMQHTHHYSDSLCEKVKTAVTTQRKIRYDKQGRESLTFPTRVILCFLIRELAFT